MNFFRINKIISFLCLLKVSKSSVGACNRVSTSKDPELVNQHDETSSREASYLGSVLDRPRKFTKKDILVCDSGNIMLRRNPVSGWDIYESLDSSNDSKAMGDRQDKSVETEGVRIFKSSLGERELRESQSSSERFPVLEVNGRNEISADNLFSLSGAQEYSNFLNYEQLSEDSDYSDSSSSTSTSSSTSSSSSSSESFEFFSEYDGASTMGL
ncbi:hypothetical protein CWI36_0121p0010 [Hamiltosporidium magnivora]|uniref:Uncharacterized protein n=1 Tax=Hamiltosporidium magnivora TaxID=148818 RepID=A0A4Q9LJZ9_9MICR|nr:hypothetical protein CWI36_0262p0030 [Hamiltosporidium magnivora]TBU08569.1 hypothetical protein CWI36_0121p0010 [Hamiltosporidium magnivora]